MSEGHVCPILRALPWNGGSEAPAGRIEPQWIRSPHCAPPHRRRHCDGRATLMVTDDAKCVQFRTEQSEDLRRIEEFNRLMVRLMSRGAAATEPTAEEQARYDQQGAAGSEAQGAGGRRGKKRR